ncbi:secondary thiamine-phosphate synthase enzyme YjbQ [Tepidamorphus sp. 3E244]|uniref:secondary thiamine-phosphate synthase enzyme YjbQ n=1 Tax=Tepidamorphus sp. 3E244 TaxID=3385498 RepID=UPI0038FC0545
MRQVRQVISLRTPEQGFTEITGEIAAWLREEGVADGMLNVFIRHTSATLTIQENADPSVQDDLVTALDAFAPRERAYRHSTEGPDDMPAHIRTMVTDVSLNIPVGDGAMLLGTWQGVYVIEHRDRPHTRQVVLTYQGT